MKSPLRAVLASLLLAVSATACNNDALPPAAGFTTVAGTVVDAGSKPVSGAVVTIDTLLTATTDANGKFSIDKVPSGIVDYTVQADGFALISSSTSVEPGKPFELDVTLAPPP
ncbi:MAG TPA: carboxypeptidase-like regulatory domain-containing protein [Candidatus Tumulicola sp.]|nr:carboxypeptidase-like regulatory domain-containing protein [Candidatus Tumulicola sp.]